MAEAGEWPTTEQEMKIGDLFKQLNKLLKKAEKVANPDKLHGVMKDVTTKLKESKALLKEFEREARTDEMPPAILAQRKKALADELNSFIARKKDVGQAIQKDELFSGAAVPEELNLAEASTQQLIQKGRRDMTDTDAALSRAERLVEDTMATGTQTAAALADQTNQLNKIVDDLADIEFNVKKATKVIRDITRGLLTDKCIGFLLFMAVAGVIVIIVLKVVNPNKKKISATIANITENSGLNNLTAGAINQGQNALNGAINGRRMLREGDLSHAMRDLAFDPSPQSATRALFTLAAHTLEAQEDEW